MMNEKYLIPNEGRILAVDLGEKRIGLAVCDELQNLARPLQVLQHVSRSQNINRIQTIAGSLGIVGIIVGVTTDDDINLNVSGQRSALFAESLQAAIKIPVVLWNEDFSTKNTKSNMIDAGVPKMKRRGHLDAHTAALILQTYLDAEKA